MSCFFASIVTLACACAVAGCGGGASGSGTAGSARVSDLRPSSPTNTTAVDPAESDPSGLPPLKPHPRVVIAAAPGQLPPGAQFADASTEGQAVQPPSDAEVRRELHQLQSA